MNRIFCCYSCELRDYLLSNGMRYDVVGLNPNSHRMFWGFIKTAELNKLLNSWNDS